MIVTLGELMIWSMYSFSEAMWKCYINFCLERFTKKTNSQSLREKVRTLLRGFSGWLESDCLFWRLGQLPTTWCLIALFPCKWPVVWKVWVLFALILATRFGGALLLGCTWCSCLTHLTIRETTSVSSLNAQKCAKLLLILSGQRPLLGS